MYLGRLGLGLELLMDEFRFRTNVPGVELYSVQDKYTWGRLGSGSELVMDEFF